MKLYFKIVAGLVSLAFIYTLIKELLNTNDYAASYSGIGLLIALGAVLVFITKKYLNNNNKINIG